MLLVKFVTDPAVPGRLSFSVQYHAVKGSRSLKLYLCYWCSWLCSWKPLVYLSYLHWGIQGVYQSRVEIFIRELLRLRFCILSCIKVMPMCGLSLFSVLSKLYLCVVFHHSMPWRSEQAPMTVYNYHPQPSGERREAKGLKRLMTFGFWRSEGSLAPRWSSYHIRMASPSDAGIDRHGSTDGRRITG